MYYTKQLIKTPTDEDIKFLKLARYVACWSDDPSTKTGAVLVNANNDVVSVDCNRLPKGLPNQAAILDNREEKYRKIIHCERAASNTAGSLTKGCKLYTWPFMSCSPCASHMADCGIVANIAPYSDYHRWLEEFEMATQTYVELGIEVKLINPSYFVGA